MTEKEFEEIVLNDDHLLKPVTRAAYHTSPPGYVGYGLTEAAAVALLFPLVRFVLTEIGLPWLHEAKRYSELWRAKCDRWISEQYAENKLDASRLTIASEALKEELTKTYDASVKDSWDTLAQKLKESAGRKVDT